LAYSVAITGAATASAEDAVPRLAAFRVEGANDDYTETELSVKKGDLIFVGAKGSVVTGSWNGATGTPWGHGGACGSGSEADGALVMKIGSGNPVRVGDDSSIEADRDGALKLKVRDTKYSDNSGAYEVKIIILSAQTLGEPKALEIEAANDEWTPAEMTVSKGDVVVVRASGEVTVLGAKRGPAGLRCGGGDADGGLSAKIGTTSVVRLGEVAAVPATASGPLKLRVRSGAKYEGNKGKYQVRINIIHTPQSATNALAQPVPPDSKKDEATDKVP
jgi:hypothetical protein